MRWAASSRLPFQQQHGSTVLLADRVNIFVLKPRPVANNTKQPVNELSPRLSLSGQLLLAADLIRRRLGDPRPARSGGVPVGQGRGTGNRSEQQAASASPCSCNACPKAQARGRIFRPWEVENRRPTAGRARLCGGIERPDCKGRSGFQLSALRRSEGSTPGGPLGDLTLRLNSVPSPACARFQRPPKQPPGPGRLNQGPG